MSGLDEMSNGVIPGLSSEPSRCGEMLKVKGMDIVYLFFFHAVDK